MLRAAEARYREAARLAAAAVVLADRAWSDVPADAMGEWQADRLTAQITALQVVVARGAAGYLDASLVEQGIDPTSVGTVSVERLVGVTGNGVDLFTLFEETSHRARVLMDEGVGARDAWHRAQQSLRRLAATAVQDAGRGADSVALVARPRASGFVRMLNTPSCSRCVVLAGRFYRWNEGFRRHPLCDCRHVGTDESAAPELVSNPMQAFRDGQVTGLSRADAQAMADGADISQVVNAHKGMSTANVFGHRLKVTTEGITKRGLAETRLGNFEQNIARAEGQRYRRSRTPRLMPESIYAVAKDRDDAIRLLFRNGYLTSMRNVT